MTERDQLATKEMGHLGGLLAFLYTKAYDAAVSGAGRLLLIRTRIGARDLPD
jgi:hypothetical protein